MTVVLQEPFESLVNWALLSEPSVTGTIGAGRNGNGLNSTYQSQLRYRLPVAAESDTVIVGFAYRPTSFTAAVEQLRLMSDDGATLHTVLRTSTSGQLTVLRGTTTLTTSVANTLVANTWYYIELRVKLGDAGVGTYEVRVNGTAVIGPLTGDTKNAGTKTVFDTVEVAGGWSASQIDDLYIATGAAEAFQGDHVVTAVAEDRLSRFSTRAAIERAPDPLTLLRLSHQSLRAALARTPDAVALMRMTALGARIGFTTTAPTYLGPPGTAAVSFTVEGSGSVAVPSTGVPLPITVTFTAEATGQAIFAGPTGATGFRLLAIATPTLADPCFVEYPVDSGRIYTRRPDGALLRVEVRHEDGSWYDLTHAVQEVSVQWGDTQGDDLTPASSAGQAVIRLLDPEGRYGPLPPTGAHLYQRWRPVRVWLGYLTDPAVPLTDLSTRYGWPGAYGSTPPAVYGGTNRVAQADGIQCRFSGWLMAQERELPGIADKKAIREAVTTWTCGDGIVRLVDQTVKDYDLSDPPNTPVTDVMWPTGLRENAPGNYRVQELVRQAHGPSGEVFPVQSIPAPTRAMMQSPGGKVGDLVAKVAESDLAFFWWQPDVSAQNHDQPADWFGYRPFDWLLSHGLEWPVVCDGGIEGFQATLVSDDRNFYSAIRAAKGTTKRTTWLPQPPWSGFAFDSSVAKIIGTAAFKVQPGDRISFKVQMDPHLTKASVEFWKRIVGSQLIKIGESTLNKDPAMTTMTTASSPVVEIAQDTPPDTVVEVQVRARSMGLITSPGYLASNVFLIVERQGGEGPIVLVDDPALADVAEVHEYERKDLMLRQQGDVPLWAQWVVDRSKRQRWILETVSQDPNRGDADWSWGAWHTMWLGDRVNLEIPDGGEIHTERQWVRGLEFSVTTDGLTLSMHLESAPTPTFRPVPGLGVSTSSASAGPSTPIPGGRILPSYESRPELPGWSAQDTGTSLTVAPDGTLVWGGGSGGVRWPIKTFDGSLHTNSVVGQSQALAAYLRLDKPQAQPGTSIYEAMVMKLHPMSADGPLWTYWGFPTTTVGLREVQEPGYGGRSAGISGEWYGAISLAMANFMWYTTSSGDESLLIPEDVIVGPDNAWEYNLDVPILWENLATNSFNYESYQDLIRHYPRGGMDPATAVMPHDQAWDGGSAEQWIGNLANWGFFTEGWSESRPQAHYAIGGIESWAPIIDRTGSYEERHQILLWSEYELDALGTGTSEVEERFELLFSSTGFRISDGPHRYGGQKPRGTLSILAAVSDVDGTVADPSRKQWFRQIGHHDVVFSGGIGSCVAADANVGSYGHVQATIRGTSVGGPRIAQATNVGPTLTFALDTAYSGTLTVSWSIEYEEPVWSTTEPFIWLVKHAGWANYYDVAKSDVVVPYSPGGTVTLGIDCSYIDAGAMMYDSSGTPFGISDITDLSIPGFDPRGWIDWTVPADAFPIDGGDTFRLFNSTGEKSNAFFAVWQEMAVPEALTRTTREEPRRRARDLHGENRIRRQERKAIRRGLASPLPRAITTEPGVFNPDDPSSPHGPLPPGPGPKPGPRPGARPPDPNDRTRRLR